jgi:hypothetical protein
MAGAAVQASGNFGSVAGTTLAQAFGSNLTGGNLATVRCRWASATATCSVAGSTNGTYTPVGSPTVNATMGESSQHFYKANVTGGPETVTMTVSTSVGYKLLSVHEMSGLATASPVDSTAFGGTSGNSAAPAVSITTVADHDFVFGSGDVANTATAGTGFTSWTSVDGNVTEYKADQTPAGVLSVAFTDSPSGQWIAIATAFLIPGAGATPVMLETFNPIPFMPITGGP